ncbi:MAG: CvpA family protein [Firmicutes bacterium]|nr:CvpA family protein [Bacillota bacterium]
MALGTIIDIVIAAVLVLSIIIGAVRGLFKSVIAVIITLVAILGSIWISGLFVDAATDYAYPKFQEKMEKIVTEPGLHLNIGGIISNATNKKLEDFMEYELTDDYFEDGFAEDVLKIAQQFGLSEKDLREPLEKGLKKVQKLLKDYLDSQASSKTSTDQDAQKAADSAVETAGKAILKPMVRAALIIILFILLLIILKIIAAIIDKGVKKTGGVKQVNALGGAVLSFVVSAVVIYILVYLAAKYGLTALLQDKLASSHAVQFILGFVPK